MEWGMEDRFRCPPGNGLRRDFGSKYKGLDTRLIRIIGDVPERKPWRSSDAHVDLCASKICGYAQQLLPKPLRYLMG